MSRARDKAKRSPATESRIDEVRPRDDVWRRDPDLVKTFLRVRPDYEQLCTEVEYTLQKRISERGIQTAAIVSRAKTLDSFLEKLQRKDYEKPLTEITDFAGARVVCLYRSDVARVAGLIREEFSVVEDVDKLAELGVDQFGYGARHFLVRLGKTSSGARYDDLKQLVCEIQVRTVVQDAWAIIQHHMVYKREAQVPSQLQRKLNSLSGLFETVDDQFERIREEREAYVVEVRSSVEKPSAFLENELNLDTFKEYLSWSVPGRALEGWDGQARLVLDALLAAGYKTLGDVDHIVKATATAREAVKQEIQETPHKILPAPDGTLPANLEAALAMSLEKEASGLHFGEDWENIIRKYRSKRAS